MQLDHFAKGFAKSLALSTVKKDLGPFLQTFKPNQIEWLIKSNRNMVDFIPKTAMVGDGNKHRYRGLAKIFSDEDFMGLLNEMRPDIAKVVKENNAGTWFRSQIELLKQRLL